MRTIGHNSFIMSGSNSQYLYDKIIDSVTNCVEFNTRYKIDKVSGNTYTIQKSITKEERIEYNIGVWKGNSTDHYSCPIGWSTFDLSDIQFEDQTLSISEDFCRGCSSIEKYIIDKDLIESGYKCSSWTL